MPRERIKRGNSPIPKAPVAPLIVRNRIQQRLTRVSSNLYLKVIQELLEMGDAIRVSKEKLAKRNESSSGSEFEDDYDDPNEYYSFPERLRQRKMSLTGVLEQSEAERVGFAALLDQKLNQLMIEDDIELEASDVQDAIKYVQPRSVSDSAPPILSFSKGRLLDDDFDEESLNILNETDSNPWNITSRGTTKDNFDELLFTNLIRIHISTDYTLCNTRPLHR